MRNNRFDKDYKGLYTIYLNGETVMSFCYRVKVLLGKNAKETTSSRVFLASNQLRFLLENDITIYRLTDLIAKLGSPLFQSRSTKEII